MALVEIAKLAVSRSSRFHFVIAGDGPQKAELLAKIREYGLENNFTLLGWRKDIPELMHASDIVTLTSLFEGLPQILSQAMAVGRPAVMFDTGGIREELHHGKNGWLIPHGDVRAFADGLIQLGLNPELLSQMGNMSFQLLNRQHHYRVMIQKLTSFYESLTDKTIPSRVTSESLS